MKSRHSLRNILALAGSSLLTISSASAQLTWDANGAGDGQTNGAGAWLGTDQWWDGVANLDWVSGSDAIFGVANTAGGAVTLASPTAVGSLTFDQFTGTYTLGTAGQEITLNGGITKNASSGAVSLISPIILGGAQTWTNNSTTNLSATGGVDTNDVTLTIDGTANTSFGGTANIITGAGGITKNGTGLLIFAAGGTTPAHNYSGPTVINGGNVMSQNNLSANSNYSLTDAMFADYYRTTTTFTGLGADAKGIQIYGASGFGGGNGNSNWRIGAQNSVLRWGTTGEGAAGEDLGASGFFNPTTLKLRSTSDNNGPSIYGQVTLQNRLDLNSGARTIDVLLGGTNVSASWGKIDAGIEDTGATGSLTKTGGGTLILGGSTSTWGGTTTVSGGVLMFDGNNVANIGGGSGRNISVADGAGVRFNALSNAILNRIVETTDEIGVMSGTTGNSFDFSSSTGADLPNAFLGNWAGNGAKATISGTITPGSNGYKFGAKGSSGLLGLTDALTGANSLTVGMTGAIGIRVNIVAANTHTGDTVINAGSKLTLGNNLALQNSALNVGSAGGTFALAAGTNGGRITGETEAASPTFGGLIGSRNLISTFTNAGGNNETNLGASAVTGFTLNVGTGNTHTYSGAIGGFGAGAVSNAGGNSTLTKTGDGTQILTGIHTYTGNTTISGGTLSLGTTGSIATSTSVTLDAGGTLETSGQSSYAIPASQSLTFGLDTTSSGKITADGLDITDAAVTFTGIKGASVYVLASYTSLTGTSFASVTGLPSGYTLDYAYETNKIALISTGGSPYDTWAATSAPSGTPADDFDGDGVSNAIEFVLGGGAATNDLDKLPVVATTATDMTFTFVRDQDSVDASVAVVIEVGTDLATWPSTYTVGADTAGSSAGVTVTDNTDGTDTITLTVAQSPDDKKFARLKVTITP